MKHTLALIIACFALLTLLALLFVSAYKPQDAASINSLQVIESLDSGKRLSAYLTDERIREIEAAKLRIKEIQERLDNLKANDPEKLSEQEISSKIGFGSLGYISPKQDYYDARKDFFSSHIKKLELNEKALADANSHLRLLLSPENSVNK
jgi:Skp family chaperone for outer membrane proteins